MRQRVDFADLVDVTEFVTAATIPNGNYVAATLRLDYSDAEVSVEVDGVPTPASVVDENGDSLGVVDLELTLDNANHVVVAAGTPALLQIDFDLAATHIGQHSDEARDRGRGALPGRDHRAGR